MALPGSGTIRFSDIRDEFGGSNPVRLSDYYRGGALVPDTSANSGVPTSGAIKLSDFYGASALVFTPGFQNTSVTLTTSPGQLGQMTLNNNATIGITGGLDNPPLGYWGLPQPTSGIGSSYEVMFDSVLGTLSVPSAGSWISLSTARVASYNQGAGGASCRVRIRPNGGSVATTLNLSFSDGGF